MKLDKLIAPSHSTEAAKAYKAYSPSPEDLEKLREIGRTLLQVPTGPGACALMSAAYAERLQFEGVPAYVVAGSLQVGKEYVFGDDKRFDGRAVFDQSNLDWNGHAWVMVGSHLADPSLFRTAYSDGSPPRLAAHVRERFGEGRGLLLGPWSDMPKNGLYYAPQYVLTEQQVTNLFQGFIARYVEKTK